MSRFQPCFSVLRRPKKNWAGLSRTHALFQCTNRIALYMPSRRRLRDFANGSRVCRSDVGARCRSDVAALSQRCVGATSQRCRSDVGAMSERRRSAVAATSQMITRHSELPLSATVYMRSARAAPLSRVSLVKWR